MWHLTSPRRPLLPQGLQGPLPCAGPPHSSPAHPGDQLQATSRWPMAPALKVSSRSSENLSAHSAPWCPGRTAQPQLQDRGRTSQGVHGTQKDCAPKRVCQPCGLGGPGHWLLFLPLRQDEGQVFFVTQSCTTRATESSEGLGFIPESQGKGGALVIWTSARPPSTGRSCRPGVGHRATMRPRALTPDWDVTRPWALHSGGHRRPPGQMCG